MKVAALAVLGVLLYLAAAEGNLGSILAVFIDPAALGAEQSPIVPGSSNDPNSPNYQQPLPYGIQGKKGPQTVKPDTKGNCPDGYININGVCQKYIIQVN